MIVRMSKVQILGPKKHFPSTVREVHRVGCLHIIDIRKQPVDEASYAEPITPDKGTERQRARFEQVIAKINGLISISLSDNVKKFENAREAQKIYDAYCERENEKLLGLAEKITREVEEKPQEIANKKEEAEKQLALYSRYKTILSKVKPLVEKLVKLEGYETTAIIIDKKYSSVIDLLKEELSKLTKNRFDVMSTDVDKDTVAALLVYPKEYTESIHQLLWSENVTQIKLPEDLAEYSYSDALSIMEDRIKNLPKKIERLKKELKGYADKYGYQLIALRDILVDRWKELSIIESFAETGYTFVMTGWVPRKRVKKLSRTLRDKFNGEVTLVELPVTEKEMEEAPVVLKNPSWAKPFELILSLFSLPKYGTIDPTPFLAIFYPLFFGIILGDIGYGLVLLLLAIFAAFKWKNSPAIRAGSYMIGFSGIMAILFGFAYNEFFGFMFWEWLGLHETHVLGIALPFERAKEEFAIAYLVFSLGIGVGHLLIGLILGVINSIKEHSIRHLVEKIGFLILFAAAAGIAASYMGKLPEALATAGWLALFFSVGLISWGGGLIGIIHIFTVVGHFFSYLRIMALGLAGVVLAIIANNLADTASNVVLGIAIATIIHSLNIVLHTFSSTIHSIRLNVLEFFDKFYESGGEPYEPFTTKRR